MTLEQASLIAQIISAIAVIASLVFVGFQLKSAAAAIRASSSQAHSSSYTQLVQSIIDNEDFARVWAKGIADPNALKEEEWVRFVAYASALFRLYESSRVQWQHGRLDDEHWHTIEQQARSFSDLPGIKAAWGVRGHWFMPAFQAWFESLGAHDAPPVYHRATESDGA